MPTIYIAVDPPANCEITEYKDYIFVYNLYDAIVFNKFIIKNIDNNNCIIESASLYLPYPPEALNILKINAESHQKRRVFEQCTKIDVTLGSLLKIETQKECLLEIIIIVKNIGIKKRPYGWKIPIHFYNLNTIGNGNNNHNDNKEVCFSNVPKILKNGLELGIILPKCLKFRNNIEYEAYISDVSEHENAKSNIRQIGDLIENKKLKKSFMRLQEGIIAIWSESQLGVLEDRIEPSWKSRLIRVGYSKKDYIEINGYSIRYFDIIVLIFTLIALIISVISLGEKEMKNNKKVIKKNKIIVEKEITKKEINLIKMLQHYRNENICKTCSSCGSD